MKSSVARLGIQNFFMLPLFYTMQSALIANLSFQKHFKLPLFEHLWCYATYTCDVVTIVEQPTVSKQEVVNEICP